MKYLKRFNESSYEKIKIDIADDVQWIEDSLLELTDVGYDVEVRPFQVKSISRPGITITIKGDKLLPISIGENLLTIDSYLKEQGFVGFNPYDYDNEYSQSRYQVRVVAFLNNIKNEYENNLPDFVNMLKRFQVNAPFNSISVSYFKPEVKVNESLYESPLVIELKDMALELTDIGYNVQIFKDRQETDDNIRIIINHTNNFTMKTDVKEFLFRAIGYMKDNGYKYDTHSNFGRLYFVEDGRIIISGGEARERYPSFTMINILFKKS
jgi:hypothetical protein